MVINRELYDRLICADFDRIKYHDWFAAIIVAAFGKYTLSDEIEAVHRQHDNNASPLYFLKNSRWNPIASRRLFLYKKR